MASRSSGCQVSGLCVAGSHAQALLQACSTRSLLLLLAECNPQWACSCC